MSAENLDSGEFETLSRFVERELDFVTSHYNDSYLQRRIRSRMRRTDTETYDEYLDTLRSDPNEGEALLNALSINVTAFFRNPDVWEGVRTVLRELSDRRSTVRIWSAGCADGREPYSLAMLALDDPSIDAGRVRITGTDVNHAALDAARDGVYVSTHTVDVAAQLDFLDDHRPYVEQEDDEFRVRSTVRDLVSFQHHDLIADEPLGGHDLVCCRNLFIYIDAAYKKPIVESLTKSLNSNGYLVIGKAETLPRDARDGYAVADSDRRIYLRE